MGKKQTPVTDKPIPGGGGGREFELASSGFKSILDLARIVLTGEATARQNAFFITGVIAVVTIIFGVVGAVGQSWGIVLTAFVGLVVVLLVSLFLSSKDIRDAHQIAMGGGGGREDLQKTQLELTAAQNELAISKASCERLQRRLHAITDNLASVQKQLTDQPRRPKVLSDEVELRIEPDGRLRGRRTVKFRAAELPQQLIVERLAGDAPVEWAEELNIDVKAGNGYRVAHLLSRDKVTDRAVMIFFLPEVPVERAEPTVYMIVWEWPRLWDKLLKGSKDSWEEFVNAADVVPSVKYKFMVHKDVRVNGLPLRLTLENLGNGVKGALIRPEPVPGEDYRVYEWAIEDAVPGQKVDLRLGHEN